MATLTINTTAPQDARLVVAFGAKIGLGRNATASEIKADIINYIRAVVFDQERLAVVSSNPSSALDPT